MLSLVLTTEETANEGDFTVEGKVEREGKVRKNQAPDFFHS